jgi:hypothetical protein
MPVDNERSEERRRLLGNPKGIEHSIVGIATNTLQIFDKRRRKTRVAAQLWVAKVHPNSGDAQFCIGPGFVLI